MVRPGFIRECTDSIVKIHEHIGLKNLKRYILLGFVVLGLFNIEPITKAVIGFIAEMSDEIHKHKMEIRDKYMTDLFPLLTELRAETGADRAIYFEFHNSEESLDGLPFKFFDEMLGSARYGLGEDYGLAYKDVNASRFTTFFNELREGSILYCSGYKDSEFRKRYCGVYELFNGNDLSEQQVVFSVPGLKYPVGFIVLEWMNDSTQVEMQERVVPKIHEFVPRINALVVSVANS